MGGGMRVMNLGELHRHVSLSNDASSLATLTISWVTQEMVTLSVAEVFRPEAECFRHSESHFEHEGKN